MNDRFGSTARDFAAGIVTREGGTPEDVRELSYGPDLDRIVSDHRAEFDWNTVPGMGARVRDWYAEQFPDDPLGVMIAPDVTFAQTVESLHGGDVYDHLGVGESVVRERVFAELSARIGCGYDDIYDAWLNGDGLDPRLVSDPDPEPERRFGIDDVEMRRSATWPGGPHVLSAELPDGRILGHVIPQEGEWLWRLADETEWHAPRPVEGNALHRPGRPGGRHPEPARSHRDPVSQADLEDPVDVLDESLTGTDPYAAPAAGPAR